MVGIGVPVTFESQGYPNKLSFESNTLNDYFATKKSISPMAQSLSLPQLLP